MPFFPYVIYGSDWLVHVHVLLPGDSSLIETNEFPERMMLYFNVMPVLSLSTMMDSIFSMGIERRQLRVAVLLAGLELLLPAMYSSVEQLQPCHAYTLPLSCF